MTTTSFTALSGFRIHAGYFDARAQAALVEEVLALCETSPPFRPVTPGGRPMSVEMTNFGALGWATDHAGYRYETRHPVTGRAWPPMPQAVLRAWRDLDDRRADPDACLVNIYRAGARMGLHQDRDEADFSFPVLSISLGDTAIFRIGGADRGAPTRTIRLSSGDVCLLAGDARLAFHGVDRVIAGSSRLIPGGGRINLTLRRAASL